MELVDGKLQTQGINTGPEDGAPAVRPYLNAIHHHWSNVEAQGFAFSLLPGFDVPPNATLTGHRLELELTGVSRWIDPPLMPDSFTSVRLSPLAAGIELSIAGNGEVDSERLGTLPLLESTPPEGASDLDLYYQINDLPSSEIYVLTLVMSAYPPAGAPSGIESSDPIHVILSPDGASPQSRLHHASLFLEAHLASVPEPSSACVSSAMICVALLIRRKRSASPSFRGCSQVISAVHVVDTM
ncbi:MAG: hypothetical protein AAGJ46_16175 [Planctomycetota bacterium]